MMGVCNSPHIHSHGGWFQRNRTLALLLRPSRLRSPTKRLIAAHGGVVMPVLCGTAAAVRRHARRSSRSNLERERDRAPNCEAAWSRTWPLVGCAVVAPRTAAFTAPIRCWGRLHHEEPRARRARQRPPLARSPRRRLPRRRRRRCRHRRRRPPRPGGRRKRWRRRATAATAGACLRRSPARSGCAACRTAERSRRRPATLASSRDGRAARRPRHAVHVVLCAASVTLSAWSSPHPIVSRQDKRPHDEDCGPTSCRSASDASDCGITSDCSATVSATAAAHMRERSTIDGSTCFRIARREAREGARVRGVRESACVRVCV